MDRLLDSSLLGAFVLLIVVFGTCWRAYSWSKKSSQGYGLRTFALTEGDALVSPKQATQAQKQTLSFYAKGFSIFATLFVLMLLYFIFNNYFYAK